MECRKSLKVNGALIVCVLLASAQSAFAVRMTAAFPADLPDRFVVQPGEATQFSIDFTNLDNDSGVGTAWIRSLLPGYNTHWFIEPMEPEICLFPVEQEGLRLDFQVELLSMETRRCTYKLRRASTTYRDGYLQMCREEQPVYYCNNRATLVFGTLPDVGVVVTPLSSPMPGASDLTFRVDVSNGSVVATNESSLYTACRYLPNGNPAGNLPFQLETGFPGACPATNIYGCSAEPPAVNFGWRLAIPSIPANGSTSCLVRMKFREPLVGPIQDRLASWPVFAFFPGQDIPLLHAGASPSQGQGYDLNTANNIADFSAIPPQSVPLDSRALWAILALLLAFAARTQIQYRPVRRQA